APAHDDAPFFAESLLGGAHRLLEVRHLVEGQPPREGVALEDLREALHTAGELAHRLLFAQHDAERLERGYGAVSGRCVIEEDQVAGLFAAKIVAAFAHGFDDVPVADLGAEELAAGAIE